MRSTAISEQWTARTGPLTALDLFARLDRRPFAFLYGEGRFLILGQGPLLTHDDLNLEPLAVERSGPTPPLLPDWIGFVGYEAGYRLEPLAGSALPPPFPFPAIYWALYQDILVYDRTTSILYQGRRRTATPQEQGPNLLARGPFSARFAGGSDSPAGYAEKVEQIREAIARGNVYQVNLTRQERWSYRGDLRSFAKRLFAANPAPFSAFIAGADFAVISSSPERLVKLESGRLIAQPIKGTAPRGKDPAEDRTRAEGLLGSAKNRAELAMIVDLLRNDLTRACRIPSVQVEAFPVLETFANVHHLVATIAGEIRPGLTLPQLLAAIFPGGSITGCPKLAAMKLIRRLESQPRMIYTGALGWIRSDFQAADWALPIRTAFASPAELIFGVGGAVVWDSDPEDEYLETVHKGSSLVQCLS